MGGGYRVGVAVGDPQVRLSASAWDFLAVVAEPFDVAGTSDLGRLCGRLGGSWGCPAVLGVPLGLDVVSATTAPVWVGSQ